MKRTESKTPLQTYETSGKELRIYWDEQIVERPGMDDEPLETFYSYKTCVSPIVTDRASLISRIIRSQMSVDDEIATINNQADKPDEYAAYQAFRALAKQLADNWLAGPVNVNTATQAELEELSGVGAATANAIIAGRPWAATADLSSISGVSDTMVSGWNVTV